MNITQMHERLRLELLRRVQRGTLSVSLLARQTAFGQSHLSNFLRGRRQLSLEAMDRILAAQHISAVDLLPGPAGVPWIEIAEVSHVPIVSHTAAMFEPLIRSSAVHEFVHISSRLLQETRARASSTRRAWTRFVAIRIPAPEAMAMDPVVLADATVLLDRHYNSLAPYRPNRPNLYAIQHDAHLKLRYADFQANRILVRPHILAAPVELIELDDGASPGDIIAGRVVLIVNEI